MSLSVSKKNPNTKEFWERKYKDLIDQEELRSDGPALDKFRELFEQADLIVDFGAGLGGNVKHIASLVNNTRFTLVDHSETSLEFAREKLLGTSDKQGNSFDYQLSMQAFANESLDMILTFQVLEHISEYKEVLDLLFSKIKPGGILMISVPVRGIRDTNRQHVNKFTLKSMFRILSEYSEIVHIASRTLSKRTGRTTTAYFYIRKPGP